MKSLAALALAFSLTAAPALAAMNTPTVPGQLPGTGTNDAASAGNVGQILTASLAIGSSVSLTSGVTANIATITLTPGDWDVWGVVDFNGAATTTATFCIAGISQSSTGLPSAGDLDRTQQVFNSFAVFNIATVIVPAGPIRLTVASNTQIWLTGTAAFAVSTATAFGTIRARRVR